MGADCHWEPHWGLVGNVKGTAAEAHGQVWPREELKRDCWELLGTLWELWEGSAAQGSFIRTGDPSLSLTLLSLSLPLSIAFLFGFQFLSLKLHRHLHRQRHQHHILQLHFDYFCAVEGAEFSSTLQSSSVFLPLSVSQALRACERVGFGLEL